MEFIGCEGENYLFKCSVRMLMPGSYGFKPVFSMDAGKTVVWASMRDAQGKEVDGSVEVVDTAEKICRGDLLHTPMQLVSSSLEQLGLDNEKGRNWLEQLTIDQLRVLLWGGADTQMKVKSFAFGIENADPGARNSVTGIDSVCAFRQRMKLHYAIGERLDEEYLRQNDYLKYFTYVLKQVDTNPQIAALSEVMAALGGKTGNEKARAFDEFSSALRKGLPHTYVLFVMRLSEPLASLI
jgi:hypothetical protein